jgi:hypothetical protein
VRGITLSSLDLRPNKKIPDSDLNQQQRSITDSVKKLALALMAATSDPSLRTAILSARKKAQDFVFGLLVDLFDYCQCLEVELDKEHLDNRDLRSACNDVRMVLGLDQNGIVVANHTDQKPCRSHGLSIYFPYRDEDETDEAEVQFAKGSGRQPLKGSGRQPLKERIQRIQELEADIAKLDRFGETKWIDFIRDGWSMILAEKAPFELDRYYSAEQATQNLLLKAKAQSSNVVPFGTSNVSAGGNPSGVSGNPPGPDLDRIA